MREKKTGQEKYIDMRIKRINMRKKNNNNKKAKKEKGTDALCHVKREKMYLKAFHTILTKHVIQPQTERAPRVYQSEFVEHLLSMLGIVVREH